MSVNEAILDRMCCDEVWLVGGRVSAGMASEWAQADEMDLAVRDLTFLGEEPPEIVPENVLALIGPPRRR